MGKLHKLPKEEVSSKDISSDLQIQRFSV